MSSHLVAVSQHSYLYVRSNLEEKSRTALADRLNFEAFLVCLEMTAERVLLSASGLR